jgi:hypothetical protein
MRLRGVDVSIASVTLNLAVRPAITTTDLVLRQRDLQRVRGFARSDPCGETVDIAVPDLVTMLGTAPTACRGVRFEVRVRAQAQVV